MEEEREPVLLVSGKLMETCKAENAWQGPAAVYTTPGKDPLALSSFSRVEGSKLSHNNRRDMQGALQTMTHIAAGFQKNFGTVPYIAVGVKHSSPCSAGVSEVSSLDAIRKMIECRPETIFGGTVLTNFKIDGEDAIELAHHKYGDKRRVLYVITGSEVPPCARKTLSRAKGRCRILVNKDVDGAGAARLDTAPLFKYARGEIQVQSNYTFVFDRKQSYVRCYGEFDLPAWKDLVLAWALGSTSPSNTITLVRDGMVIANAVAQHDRRIAAKLALLIAEDVGHSVDGVVAYSDSFFPVEDAPKVLIDAGVKTIFTMTGSIRDTEVISYMVNRGVRLVTMPEVFGRGFYGS